MRTRTATSVALLALSALPMASAFAQSDMPMNKMPMNKMGGMKPSMMDKKWMMMMGNVNAAEISMSKMALMKSKDAKVRAYANMMITEHTMAHKELLALAKKEMTMVPSAPNPKQKAMAAALMKKSGKAFDEGYWMAQTMGHTEAAAMTAKAASMATDADVKAYFAKYAPRIKMHLTDAKNRTASMSM